jgi:hypothetical protein
MNAKDGSLGTVEPYHECDSFDQILARARVTGYKQGVLARVAQPPINPALRRAEQPSFWTGLALLLVAFIFLLSGATHLTGIETTDGKPAREFELVKAFARGGLIDANAPAPLDLSILDDPSAAAAAFEQLDRQSTQPRKMKYRVDSGAANPCPT